MLSKKELAVVEKAFEKAGGGCVEINGDENEPINQLCLYWYTDVGEDWSFVIQGETLEDMCHDLYNYYQTFDIDEDVDLQLQMRGHPCARLCVQNAEDKVEFLENFSLIFSKEIRAYNALQGE